MAAAESALPANTVVINAKEQRARLANGFAVAKSTSSAVLEELGPPINIFQEALPAETPPMSPVAQQIRDWTEEIGKEISLPAPPPTKNFWFMIHSFEIQVPVAEHIVVDEALHVFAIPQSSPVNVRSPRGQEITVRTSDNKTLKLISSGIFFPFGGSMNLSIFFAAQDGGVDD